MLIDLHTHTQYSYDADKTGTIDGYAQTAIDKGISTWGITEHVDFFRKEEHIIADVDAEREEIIRCRETFGDRLKILAGVEIGQPHASPEDANAFLDAHEFDYVIGSIHAMPNDIDLYFFDYAKLRLDDVYQEYFDEMEKLLDFGRFQILGHIDYPLRVMKLPDNNPTFAGCMDRVEVILKRIIDEGIALEINGKSLKSWRKAAGPEKFVLERYKELGGELITLGSDAHAAEELGRGIEQSMTSLRELGFRYVHSFENEKWSALPL